MVSATWFSVVLSGLCLPVWSQDTVALKAVDILSNKEAFSALGKKEQVMDSALLSMYRFKNLGELLSENSGLFIKSYGPGALASSALRGGSAYHSALLWNGFNIQNPMLGQSDLSTLPVLLFDKVKVEYGASSALWGSGAVAGSIALGNASRYGQGTSSQLQFSANSLAGLNAALSAEYSKKNWILSTKLYGIGSKNRYLYKNDTGAVLTQQSAAYQFMGLLQEFRLKLNPRQELSVNAWLNSNLRRLPPADQSQISKTWQADQALRFNASWNYNGKRFRSGLRSAVFSEKLNYTDSLQGLFSKSRANTFILEDENTFQYHPQHRMSFGFNSTICNGTSDSYQGLQQTQRVSLLAGQQSAFFRQTLKTGLNLRAEYFSAGQLPFTGNIFAQYTLLKDITFRMNIAKIYRQPTLNELYWQPGGNPALKPEQGYSYETGLDYKTKVNDLSLNISVSSYSRKVKDWVLWLPSGAIYSKAQNIQEVWSRGSEGDLSLSANNPDWGWKVAAHGSYVLSTVVSDDLPNSNALGKQLIYTPVYLMNASAYIYYESISLNFFHQYTSSRYTSSDNSQWLDPYQLSSLKLSYGFEQKSYQLITFLACNNLFNTNYSVMAGHPMPLRNYEIGLCLMNKSSKPSDPKIYHP